MPQVVPVLQYFPRMRYEYESCYFFFKCLIRIFVARNGKIIYFNLQFLSLVNRKLNSE